MLQLSELRLLNLSFGLVLRVPLLLLLHPLCEAQTVFNAMTKRWRRTTNSTSGARVLLLLPPAAVTTSVTTTATAVQLLPLPPRFMGSTTTTAPITTAGAAASAADRTARCGFDLPLMLLYLLLPLTSAVAANNFC